MSKKKPEIYTSRSFCIDPVTGEKKPVSELKFEWKNGEMVCISKKRFMSDEEWLPIVKKIGENITENLTTYLPKISEV
ncbi:MAG: hypothetical protein R3Y33_05675 [Clostridia bacterium]